MSPMVNAAAVGQTALGTVHIPMVLTLQKTKMMIILLFEFIRCCASVIENDPHCNSQPRRGRHCGLVLVFGYDLCGCTFKFS